MQGEENEKDLYYVQKIAGFCPDYGAYAHERAFRAGRKFFRHRYILFDGSI